MSVSGAASPHSFLRGYIDLLGTVKFCLFAKLLSSCQMLSVFLGFQSFTCTLQLLTQFVMKLKTSQFICVVDHLSQQDLQLCLFFEHLDTLPYCFQVAIPPSEIAWWLFCLLSFIGRYEERCKPGSSSMLAKNCRKVKRKIVFYLRTGSVVQKKRQKS